MSPLLLTVLVTLSVLVALIFAMVLATARADQFVTIRGPMATAAELENQIETKRATLTDLDADLDRRREALANLAGMQAEVDALIRQRDELLAELQQMDDRREEVRAMRRETEEAHAALADATRDLADRKAELERVEVDLAEARRLVPELDAMRSEKQGLDTVVAQLRRDVAALEALRGREAELKEQVRQLESHVANLRARIDEQQVRLKEAEAGAAAAGQELTTLKGERDEARAAVRAARQETDALSEQKTGLVARIAALEAELENLESRRGTAGAGGSGVDPLSELHAMPKVLDDLRRRNQQALETEAEALLRLARHVSAAGLIYPTRVLRAFHTAMKVNESTQMAVLAGISGTGKSQLPRRYAEGMGMGFLQVPVQPRWDSPQDLMGFYNYIEGRFRPTDMARALWHMDRWNGPEESHDLQDRMLMILLDEMNLARVEYYFSDFLSRLESRPPRAEEAQGGLRKDAEIELEIPVERPPRIYPGYNLLFAGTMNEDESTQTLSDKVVDRANVLRFAAPRRVSATERSSEPEAPAALSWTRWQGWVRGTGALAGQQRDIEGHVARIVELMRRLHRPIGHRLGRAIRSYVANYPHDGEHGDPRLPLADQVEMRLLPKLRGLETEAVSSELSDLVAFVRDDLGDVELAEALRESIDMSDQGTGQFVWRGVNRA